MNQTLFAIPPLAEPPGAHEGVGSVAPVFAVARIVFSVVVNGAAAIMVAPANGSLAGAVLWKSRLNVSVPPGAVAGGIALVASVTIK